MEIGGKDQRDTEKGEEAPDDHALNAAIGRIGRLGDAQPGLERDHGTRDLRAHHHKPGYAPQYQPDHQFVEQKDEDLDEVGRQARQRRRDKRIEDEAENQRKAQPHPRRDDLLPQRRHEHQHGADAREQQQIEVGGLRQPIETDQASLRSRSCRRAAS
jgi:hypothetical protein